MEEVNNTYMKKCLYHKTLHPLCPVFSLGYVVQESGQDFRSLAVNVRMGWGCASKESTAQGHNTCLPAPSCLPNLPGTGCVYAWDCALVPEPLGVLCRAWSDPAMEEVLKIKRCGQTALSRCSVVPPSPTSPYLPPYIPPFLLFPSLPFCCLESGSPSIA